MGIGHSGLSGVRAATFDLSTIGNNVSNAGTVGFKRSTAEFADVMSGATGGGVEISDLRQNFSQGSIQGTGNTWDLAISGRGFFKVSEGSDDPNVAVKDNYYTRNGSFGVDANGYVVNSRGMRLHMFEAKTAGNGVEFPVSINTTEIQIQQNDSQAKATEGMTGMFNLDARVDSRGTASITGNTETIDERLVVGSQFKLNGKLVTATGHAVVNGTTAGTLAAGDSININGVDIATTGSQLSDFVAAINGQTATTGVSAALSGLGELKLTSSTHDIQIKDTGAGKTLYQLGLHTVDENVDTAKITPAITRQTLINDINGVGAGVMASMDEDVSASLSNDGAIILNASIDITVESVTNVDTGDAATTRDFLAFAGLSEGKVQVSYNGTVNPSDDASYDHSVTSIIYDTLGSKQTINTFFQKVTDGKWEVFTQRVDSLGNTYPFDKTQSLKVGEIEFDGSGALSKITSGKDGATVVYDTTVIPKILNSTKLTMESGSPAVGKDGYLTLDIGGTNQFAGKFRIIELGQDGYSSGALTSVDVDEDGIIRASYTNGNTLELGKIALFEFNNQRGLRQEGGVLWAATNDSGEARPGEPGESIYGRIKSQSLESSSVDVTEELVNLITAQRNFQANSKMISASKEMNQVVLNI